MRRRVPKATRADSSFLRSRSCSSWETSRLAPISEQDAGRADEQAGADGLEAAGDCSVDGHGRGVRERVDLCRRCCARTRGRPAPRGRADVDAAGEGGRGLGGQSARRGQDAVARPARSGPCRCVACLSPGASSRRPPCRRGVGCRRGRCRASGRACPASAWPCRTRRSGTVKTSPSRHEGSLATSRRAAQSPTVRLAAFSGSFAPVGHGPSDSASGVPYALGLRQLPAAVASGTLARQANRPSGRGRRPGRVARCSRPGHSGEQHLQGDRAGHRHRDAVDHAGRRAAAQLQPADGQLPGDRPEPSRATTASTSQGSSAVMPTSSRMTPPVTMYWLNSPLVRPCPIIG